MSIEGSVLRFSHLEKVLFPDAGFTKGDLLTYYRRIGPFMLPHLRARAVTLRRFPEGVDGVGFYEKQCLRHRPCRIEGLADLLQVANLAAIELHVGLARLDRPQEPDQVVFDLDPGDGIGLRECAEIALRLRRILRLLGLEAFPKTSGKKGLHLYLPVRGADFGATGAFAREVAEMLEREVPDRVVTRMARRLRAGKVFIDWSQNVDFKTTACAYTLRAEERPTVSTPLLWAEVESAARRDSFAAKLAAIEAREALRRAEKLGDLFAPVLTLEQWLARTGP